MQWAVAGMFSGVTESQVTAGTLLWRFMVLRACLPAGATR